jgi:hypothetical protein
LRNDTFVSQGKYIKDMFKKFGMNEAKPISKPMGTNGSLHSDKSGNLVGQKMYRLMIGSLLYVTHQDRMSCLVYVCVQDFKPHQEKVI